MLNALAEHLLSHLSDIQVAHLSGSWGLSLLEGVLLTCLRAEGICSLEINTFLES